MYLCPSLTPPRPPLSPTLSYTALPTSPLSTTLSASYVGYLRGDQAGAGFFIRTHLSPPSFLSTFPSLFTSLDFTPPLFLCSCLHRHHPLHHRKPPPFFFSLFGSRAGCAFRQCSQAVANQNRSLRQMPEIRWRQAQPIASRIYTPRAAADVPCLT